MAEKDSTTFDWYQAVAIKGQVIDRTVAAPERGA